MIQKHTIELCKQALRVVEFCGEGVDPTRSTPRRQLRRQQGAVRHTVGPHQHQPNRWHRGDPGNVFRTFGHACVGVERDTRVRSTTKINIATTTETATGYLSKMGQQRLYPKQTRPRPPPTKRG